MRAGGLYLRGGGGSTEEKIGSKHRLSRSWNPAEFAKFADIGDPAEFAEFADPAENE
jgi:hypothetical protein